jgi:hypothetical protein
MGLLTLLRKDSGARNCFLGESSWPYSWGKKKCTPGSYRRQGRRAVMPALWVRIVGSLRGLGRICGLAARLKPCPSLSRFGLFCADWDSSTGKKQQIPRFARNDNL